MEFEPEQKDVYNMFEAVVDVVHREKKQKLKRAKCTKCGRLNMFRPNTRA